MVFRWYFTGFEERQDSYIQKYEQIAAFFFYFRDTNVIGSRVRELHPSLLTLAFCLGSTALAKTHKKCNDNKFFCYANITSLYYFYFTKPKPLMEGLEKCTEDIFSAALKKKKEGIGASGISYTAWTIGLEWFLRFLWECIVDLTIKHTSVSWIFLHYSKTYFRIFFHKWLLVMVHNQWLVLMPAS